MSKEWFGKLIRRRLTLKTKGYGFHKGTRISHATGSSFDFSDYRNYEPGDDPRSIDWNVYGRTEKYYIKRFLDEREISVAIYLDCTASMEIDDDKWKLGKQLAGAFAFITLASGDRLTFVTGGIGRDTPIVKRKGMLYGKQMYEYILGLPKGKETSAEFAASLDKRFIKNVDLSIIITDGLEPVDQFSALFKRIAPLSKQIRFLQVLGKDEVSPLYSHDVQLIDSENGRSVNVTMSNRMIALYKKRLAEHNETLSALCKRYGISYLQVTAEEEIRKFLLRTCVKHGWLE